MDQSGLMILPITTTRILTNTALAFHHRDPFDKLIIAQALSESWIVVSKDGVLEDYNVK